MNFYSFKTIEEKAKYMYAFFMNIQRIVLISLVITFTACTQARQSEVPPVPVVTKVNRPPQLVQISSQLSFEDTVTKLQSGIMKRPLKLFAEIDHAAGAASVDRSLAPSTLFIFGNPQGGTPLMQRNPKMGIILPLKMHIYEDGETVYISYPDIASISESYGLDKSEPPVPAIARMLKDLAEEVSK